MIINDMEVEGYTDAFASEFLTNVASKLESNEDLSIEEMEISIAALPAIAEQANVEIEAAPLNTTIEVETEKEKVSDSTITRILNATSKVLRNSLSSVKGWIITAWTKVSGWVKTAWNWSVSKAKQIAAWIKVQTPKVIAKIKAAGIKAWEKGIVVAWNWSTGKIKSICGMTWTAMKKAWAFVATKFMDFVHFVVRNVKKAVNAVDQFIGKHVGPSFPYSQVVMLRGQSVNALEGLAGRIVSDMPGFRSVAVHIDGVSAYEAMMARLAGQSYTLSVVTK